MTTGKLTVTHPEASRYFMLIPEAAGLILQAGAMGEGGEVFVLDMGEPIKIVELAKNLIRLSGKELGVDAEIVFTGLRPGEKLHEELIVEGEDVSGTAHPKVMKLIGNERMAHEWGTRLEELIGAARAGNHLGVVEKLDALVKGYSPMYEFHGGPDATVDIEPDLPFPPPKSVH
ncbi:MAG: polysaccharide biosynthesis protein [Candidatus Deferrimicrobiaceae bacterium]